MHGIPVSYFYLPIYGGGRFLKKHYRAMRRGTAHTRLCRLIITQIGALRAPNAHRSLAAPVFLKVSNFALT